MYVIDRIANLVVSNEHRWDCTNHPPGGVEILSQAKNLWRTPSFMMQTSQQQCAIQKRNILSFISSQKPSFTYFFFFKCLHRNKKMAAWMVGYGANTFFYLYLQEINSRPDIVSSSSSSKAAAYNQLPPLEENCLRLVAIPLDYSHRGKTAF